jgi:hypothetical protein
MTFKKCSIRGKIYGYVMDENGNEIQDPKVRTKKEIFIFYLNYFFQEIKIN